MSSKTLNLAGICGIIAPIIIFTSILLAINSYPQFSWTKNALSDLGVQGGAAFFNSGLIIGGILSLAFSYGIYRFLQKSGRIGKTGAILFAIGSLSMSAIGIFPESAGPIHLYVSFAFFMLLPLSTFLMAASLFRKNRKLSLFTFAVAIVSIIAWALPYGQGIAMPQIIPAISISVWSVVLGLKLLKTRMD